MAQQTIIGTPANDPGADSLFAATAKINAMFAELYAAKAAFRVHKNGTAQSGLTYNAFTKLTWSTEAFDSAGLFASDRWTPPGGQVSLMAMAQFASSVADNPGIILAIYKNGNEIARGRNQKPAGRDVSCLVSVVDPCSGTDYYEVFAFQSESGGGTASVSGAAVATYFCGHII